MESKMIILDEMTVQGLINALERIENKNLPVFIRVGEEGTDYCWLDVYEDVVAVGIT